MINKLITLYTRNRLDDLKFHMAVYALLPVGTTFIDKNGRLFEVLRNDGLPFGGPRIFIKNLKTGKEFWKSVRTIFDV